MRILYHHRTTAQDGSAVHIDGLIGALRDLGAEVRVVAPSVTAPALGAPSGRSWMAGARKRLPRFAHELGELAYNATETGKLQRAVDEFRPDVLYQRSNLFLLSGSWVAARAGLPLIEEVNSPYFLERSRHGGIAIRSLANWAERRAWCAANAVITVTEVLADIVAAQGVPRDRLHVMPNGIDQSLLRPDAIDRSAKHRLGLDAYTVLGFTGFVRDWNGLDAVLEQLASPAGSRWYMLVVGDGPARSAIEQKARQLGVGERLRFTGLVERAEVPGYVSAFDVALQPAANPYASPLKLFEYMVLGRAIVAPDQPNIREVLTAGQDALLFDSANAAALGSAVERLATDPALRLRLAAGAGATIRRRNLTWRHNAERVLSLASHLASSRRAASTSP